MFLLVFIGFCFIMYGAFFLDPMPMMVDRIHFYIMAACAPIVLVGIAIMLYWSFFCKSRIEFYEDFITLPKLNWLGIPSRQIKVRYDQLVSVERRRFVHDELMLQIVHPSGKTTLFSNMFTKRQDFEMVASILSRLMDENGTVTSS